jgi:hypothetical protein
VWFGSDPNPNPKIQSVRFKESPSVAIDIFTRSRDIDRSERFYGVGGGATLLHSIARRARGTATRVTTTTARRGLRYSRHRGREHRRSLDLL